MRHLVTGATGKVGNAIVHRLVERGDEVVALVRNPDAAREHLPLAVEMRVGDVTDRESLRNAVAGAEGVFNCMGLFEQWLPDPGEFERVNAYGARNVVVAARDAGARRVIHTSTFDVFHAPTGGIVTEDALADYPKHTPYERSKQHAEEMVLEAAGDEIELVIVNPSGVFGPGPWAAAGLDGMIRDAIRRRLPVIPPGGISLGFIDDVAEGHLAAFERGSQGRRYILGDQYKTIWEVVDAAASVAGRGFVPPVIPTGLARAIASGGELVSQLIKRPPLLGRGQLEFLLWQAHVDNSRARDELGITFTSFDQGIAKTVAWMQRTGRI